MKQGKLFVGTSGWSYSHWAKGRFYPKGLKQGEWLGYYCKYFSTVELNASFYRLPNDKMVDRWVTTVPKRFRFSVKMWRLVTHQKKLNDCRDQLKRFLEVAGKLGSVKGPLLVQLPPGLEVDEERLKQFLEDLKKAQGRSRWKAAVEFRHPSWICDSVYEILDRNRAAMVLADMKRCPITEPNDASFVYIRRHGPEGDYRGSYSRNVLMKDAKRITGWLKEGRDVYVYFNNDYDGYAVDNARLLMELTEEV